MLYNNIINFAFGGVSNGQVDMQIQECNAKTESKKQNCKG